MTSKQTIQAAETEKSSTTHSHKSVVHQLREIAAEYPGRTLFETVFSNEDQVVIIYVPSPFAQVPAKINPG